MSSLEQKDHKQALGYCQLTLHVFQSLLCVEYCDCWFYSKIFMIPSVILIGLCWCLPHTYKLHFDDYFIVDFELSSDQAFSLNSMNVCYLSLCWFYWRNNWFHLLVFLVTMLFWICHSWIDVLRWFFLFFCFWLMMEILLISFFALKLSDLYLPLTFCDFNSGLYFHLDSSLGYSYLNFETHFGVGRVFH